MTSRSFATGWTRRRRESARSPRLHHPGYSGRGVHRSRVRIGDGRPRRALVARSEQIAPDHDRGVAQDDRLRRHVESSRYGSSTPAPLAGSRNLRRVHAHLPHPATSCRRMSRSPSRSIASWRTSARPSSPARRRGRRPRLGSRSCGRSKRSTHPSRMRGASTSADECAHGAGARYESAVRARSGSRSRGQAHQSVDVREVTRLRPIGDVELSVDVPQMELDRLLGHPELRATSLLVAPAATSWSISSSRFVSGKLSAPISSPSGSGPPERIYEDMAVQGRAQKRGERHRMRRFRDHSGRTASNTCSSHPGTFRALGCHR